METLLVVVVAASMLLPAAGLVWHEKEGWPSVAATAAFKPNLLQSSSLNTSHPTVSTFEEQAAVSSQYVSFAVTTARHIELKDKGVNVTQVGSVDTALLVVNTSSAVCTVAGIASSHPTRVVWTYSVERCLLPTITDVDVHGMSDDGSRVALAARVAGTGPAGTPGIQVHIIDGQTGSLHCVHDTNVNATDLAPQSLSMMYNGARVAVVVGKEVRVINTTALDKGQCPVKYTVNMGYSVTAHMCPMGYFITFGFVNQAVVYRWNEVDNFEFSFELRSPDNKTSPTEWVVMSSMISVNGEDTNPFGCVVAFGWMRSDGMQAAVSVHSMLTRKQFLDYRSPVSPAGQNVPVAMAMHLGYLVVGFWGSEVAAARVPTVALFSFTNPVNKTVFEAVTSGSVFGVDIVVDAYQQPPMTTARQARNNGQVPVVSATQPTDTVYLTAASKHVHANVEGDGGDWVVWKAILPAAPDH